MKDIILSCLILSTLLTGVQNRNGRVQRNRWNESPINNTMKLMMTSNRIAIGQWKSHVKAKYDISGQEVEQELKFKQKVFDDGVTMRIQIFAMVTPIIILGKKDRNIGRTGGINRPTYKLHDYAKNWFEALEICFSENSHLVIINSKEEAKAVAKLFQDHPKTYFDWRDKWVYAGIHDMFVEGIDVTIFSERVNKTGYSVWKSNVKNGDKKNCGKLNAKGEYGHVSCSTAMAFICEKET